MRNAAKDVLRDFIRAAAPLISEAGCPPRSHKNANRVRQFWNALENISEEDVQGLTDEEESSRRASFEKSRNWTKTWINRKKRKDVLSGGNT